MKTSRMHHDRVRLVPGRQGRPHRERKTTWSPAWTYTTRLTNSAAIHIDNFQPVRDRRKSCGLITGHLQKPLKSCVTAKDSAFSLKQGAKRRCPLAPCLLHIVYCTSHGVSARPVRQKQERGAAGRDCFRTQPGCALRTRERAREHARVS